MTKTPCYCQERRETLASHYLFDVERPGMTLNAQQLACYSLRPPPMASFMLGAQVGR